MRGSLPGPRQASWLHKAGTVVAPACVGAGEAIRMMSAFSGLRAAAWRNRMVLAVLGILLLVTGVQIGAMRPGHDWGDDFALYIMLGRNIIQGTPYADTG